ncbi:MAG: VWA domain-containing protein [Methylophaga sp.]|nr:VWA domain-containing protein [Methylophaga sp.]
MTLLGLHWSTPNVLFLLPLIILPWLNRKSDKTVVWIDFVPIDSLSKVIGRLLKLLASTAIAGLVLALAGPYVPEKKVERVAEGAEIVMVLDRSRSMDGPFAVKERAQLVNYDKENNKRRIATNYLKEFVKKRPNDRFGFIFFSANSADILPMTYNKEAILATINANALGRGLSDTNMVDALITSAKMFEGKTYRGSRIVLLVSDGGQGMNDEEKLQISTLYRQLNITIYWIYMRSIHGMTLEEKEDENSHWKGKPERELHTFFKSINQPYQVFEAEELKDFSEAIDEIDRQQYQTLIVEETLPRELKDKPFYWVAMIAMLFLMLAQFYTAWGVKETLR